MSTVNSSFVAINREMHSRSSDFLYLLDGLACHIAENLQQLLVYFDEALGLHDTTDFSVEC